MLEGHTLEWFRTLRGRRVRGEGEGDRGEVSASGVAGIPWR